MDIHLSDDTVWGEKGDTKILCNQVWTSPVWGEDAIFRKDMGLGGMIIKVEDEDTKSIYLYTRDNPVATCPLCIEKRVKEISLKNVKRLEELKLKQEIK